MDSSTGWSPTVDPASNQCGQSIDKLVWTGSTVGHQPVGESSFRTAFRSQLIAGMYSFCQLMTASMPTFIGRNITAIRPTHDCFYANLGHIMTAFMPTIGQIVWLQKVNLSLLFCQLYLTSWWYHCLHANSSWIIYLLWTHLLILNHLAGLLDTNSNDHTASDKNSLLPDHVLNRKVHVMPQTMGTWRLNP